MKLWWLFLSFENWLLKSCRQLNLVYSWYIHIKPDLPIPSMYVIFTPHLVVVLVNVGKYSSPMDGMGYMQCALEPRHGHESRVYRRRRWWTANRLHYCILFLSPPEVCLTARPWKVTFEDFESSNPRFFKGELFLKGPVAVLEQLKICCFCCRRILRSRL